MRAKALNPLLLGLDGVVLYPIPRLALPVLQMRLVPHAVSLLLAQPLKGAFEGKNPLA
jgi:hypothetical protein